ncbi:MAG TPA: SDR family oxidoreductase, partial [Acidimicrobiales bacterium]|nr:SDR family oxidoreductase [Acidimicrobiales bacterium]
ADDDGLHPHYAAAKAGVVAFTRSVAAQLVPYNVNVNAVAPGLTRTGHLGRNDDSPAEPNDGAAGLSTPLDRLNEPIDIANAVLFLTSAGSRNVTGQLLTVAGGLNPSL